MVKVSYKAYDELIIHEYQKFSLEDLMRLRCTGLQVGSIAPSFQWADGTVMWREPFPQNEEITKENLEGRVHWIWVAFAPMLEFKPSLVLKETSVTVPVINLSDNPVFKAAAAWLREHT
jgi:hypothetical protein